jgi:WD40 repeat protein
LASDLDFGIDMKFPDLPGKHEIIFAPNGKTFAATLTHGYTTQVWDIRSGAMTPINVWRDVRPLVFSSPGLFLVTSDCNGSRLWDVETGTITRYISGLGSSSRVTLSPTGNKLATACDGGTIELWNTQSGLFIGKHYLGRRSRKLSFLSDGLYLQNSFGKLAVNTSVSDTASEVHAKPCWQFAFDQRWLTCNGGRILWLPHEYDVDHLDFYDNMIATLADSGVPTLLTVNFMVGTLTSVRSVSLGTP